MGLGSIVSETGLSFYAEVALLIFFGVFIAVVFQTMRKSKRADYEAAGRIPLDDHVPTPRETTRQETAP